MIRHLDHLVLTVRDPEATVAFYTRVLGFAAVTFGDGRRALRFGRQRIHLHDAAHPRTPHARHPTPGSADLCFLTDEPLGDVVQHLRREDVPILEGPVRRTGARGPILSVYFRDPDGNLLEVATYDPEGAGSGPYDRSGTLA